MNNNIFEYESFMNEKSYYRIEDNGIAYQSSKNEKIFLLWDEIDVIKDTFLKEKISLFNKAGDLVYYIPYNTTNFTNLLGLIADRIQTDFKCDNSDLTITKNKVLNYIVIACFSILIFWCIISPHDPGPKIFFGMFFFLWLLFTIFIPQKIILNSTELTIKYLFRTKTLNWLDLKGLDLIVARGHKSVTMPVILLTLPNTNKITLGLFNIEIVSLFFLLRTLWNKASKSDCSMAEKLTTA